MSHDDHQQKFELHVQTSVVFIPPPPSPLPSLCFPSTSAAGSGIHVNLWVPVLAGHPSHHEMHGVTWQRPMPLHPTQLAKGYPPTLLPSTPPSPSMSSRMCLPLPSHMPHHHTTLCIGVDTYKPIDGLIAAGPITNKPLQQYVLSSAGGNAPQQQCSAATTITHISPAEPIATSSPPHPPASAFMPTLESWTPFWFLANPEKALIILDQWVMQPGFAKGVLLVFPLSCCIVLKVFISVWGEEKGRSCCFASS
ncbi:hypothetical protein CPB84DRAFT_1853162 [Gymnopilus junonius]|uniref:Uncharacterized protein n=1 Tax=Gymnopilus junonius TaxID=109634 RepID=A0A9P5TFV5_GYMJU|nr:hypothetical protein CPB84DRAFT_1853162 [Gymnopilus junonius]